MEILLTEAQQKQHEAEVMAEELRMHEDGLKELQLAISENRGNQAIAEWHRKMETLRLEEMKHRRTVCCPCLSHALFYVVAIFRRNVNASKSVTVKISSVHKKLNCCSWSRRMLH